MAKSATRAAKGPSHLVNRASRATILLTVAAAALWVVAVHRADYNKMGALGLITVLGPAYFLGLALVAVAFGIELLRTRLRQGLLLTLTVLLAVYLFGTASAVEPLAALASSWVHAGYVQYILVHGHPLNNFAAEFSWPGGFSLGAVIVAFAGQHDATTLLRWFPLAIELSYLAPVLVIARSSGAGRRASWLAVGIFYSANWIYQDYFSPQAINYLFYLVMLAAVLAAWRPRRFDRPSTGHIAWRTRLADSRRVLTLRRMAGEDTTTDWTSREVLGLLGMLTLLSLAVAISHQLTPYALVVALAVCLVTRRLGRPELIVVVALFAAAWLSLGASNYWVGHLNEIFGSVGAIGGAFGSNVASRVTGSSSHLMIVEVRILLTAALFGLAGIGALRRAADSRTLEGLAIAPFFLLFFQNYGGEGLLRVVLFALPAASLLAASAVMPRRTGNIRAVVPTFRVGSYARPVLAVASAAVLLAFSLTTTLVRGGNDAYETFTPGEGSAVAFVYAHALQGESIGMIASYLPLYERSLGAVKVYVISDGSASTPGEYFRILVAHPASWLVLSKSQEAWGEIVAGYPPGWQDALERRLVRHGYHVVAAWPTATVLRYVTPR